jgi:integrase
VVACYGLLRLSEIENLQFENIKFENSVCFITINRKKQPGVSRNTFFAIDDPNCVKVLQVYCSFFEENDRKGRFLRYFHSGKGTQRNVGKNRIAEYPKRVAEQLGLSPIGYTGHCWRRTTATLLAETDISLMQFKNAGGWHSDRVCQEYVAESTREKLQISSRISLGPGTKKRSREEEESTSSEIPEGANTSSTTISVDMSHSSGSIFYFTPNHHISYCRK